MKFNHQKAASDVYFNEFFTVLLTIVLFFTCTIQVVQAQNPCGFPVFSNGTSFQSGDSPNSVDSGDVNNDGKLDVVTVNSGSGNLSVFLGTGTGNFETTRNFNADTSPRFVRLKDLNNDGNLDVVVTNQGPNNKVTILLGDGGGNFSIFVQYPLYNPFQTEISDVNNDGQLDLAVINGDSYRGWVSVFPGLGNGTFGTRIDTVIQGGVSNTLAVEDFNRDGNKDFVDTTTAGIRLWLGDGTGNFTMGWTSNQGYGGIVKGHLNNDDQFDLAVFNSTFEYVQIFLNAGNGTFQAAGRYAIGAGSYDLKIADLNRDGLNDIATANFVSNEISILLASGNGQFAQVRNQTTTAESRSLTIGDFNNDARPDVVTVSPRNDSIMLNLGKGDGSFRAPTNINILGSSSPNSAAVADFNADGRDDIAAAASDGISVFMRSGNYRFAPQQKFIQSTYVNYLTAADFNRDGKLDLFAVGISVGTLLLGDGTGNFTVSGSFVALPGGGFAVYVGSADFNGDGKTDIVVSDRDVGRFVIWFGNGDGTFGNSPASYNFNGDSLQRIDIGDVNNDGKPDLVIVVDTGTTLYGRVEVRLNQGNGTFPGGTYYNVGNSIHPKSVITKDFNGDGKLDFAVTTLTDPTLPGQVWVFFGNGNGTFNHSASYPVEGIDPYDLVAKDFNQDGKPDIAAINYFTEDVSVFAGVGGGMFALVQKISAGDNPRTIVAGNFNNDSGTDLVGINYRGGSLTLIPNECNQAAEFSAKYDFDGDRKTDISIFRPNAGEWWINRSSTGATAAAQFGSPSDKPVPADFTGDGRTDIAIWRPSSGEWFILRSEDGSFYSVPFGTNGDVPVVGDFDADGKADAGVFRPSTNEWFIQKSSGGTIITTFGAAGDVPVTADYDGDGKSDIAVFRPSIGEWWVKRSSNNTIYAFQFGTSTDKPVQGDYSGDGKDDPAFYRPATGEWFILRSEDSSFYSVPFGASGDLPVPGDYDADGKFDTTVFRPSVSAWYVNRTTAGILITTFGTTGDQPLPNVFVP